MPAGEQLPVFRLFHVYDQFHPGMDMATNLEGSRGCKAFGNIFARGFFVGIEAEARSLNVDLVNEVVGVGEGQAFAAIDGDFAGPEGSALLHDGMDLIGCKSAGRDQEQDQQ
jgi:hypothetical protein